MFVDQETHPAAPFSAAGPLVSKTGRKALRSIGTLAFLLCLALSPRASSADVNKAPKSYLLGPATGFSAPSGIAVDSQGNRYVANLTAVSVTVYAPDATGNAAPIRTISGSNTKLVGPRSVAVDGDGRIYVGDLFGTNQVAVFAPGADGNVAPERVITGSNTLISWPQGLAVDSIGRIYVANRNTDTITVYAPGTDGDTAPIRTISGAATGLDEPMSLVLSSDNVLNVVNGGSASITSYASGASGNAAPIRTIAGAATQMTDPGGIARDSFDNLYVTSVAGVYSVSVFKAGANGNVAPLKRLTGSETDLNTSYSVAVTPKHEVLSLSYASDALLTYTPLVAPPAPPSVVRSLAVSGTPDSAKRSVTWRKPKSDGGSPILSYQIVVTAKGKTLLTRKVSADKLKLVLKKSDLKPGKNLVTVKARNKYGLSAKSSTIIRVAD